MQGGTMRPILPMRMRIAAALCLGVNVLTIAPSLADGELFREVLSGVRKAEKTTNELYDDTNYEKKTLNDIRKKKPPQTRESSRWKKLVDNYSELAASISALSVQASYN